MAVHNGKGTLLGIDVSGGTTYVTVAQRVKIQGPSAKVRTADRTHLDSTAVEYKATLAEGGELSLSVFYDPADATHISLKGLLSSLAEIGCQLTYNDNSVLASRTKVPFKAILTGFEPNGMEVEGLLGADLTFQVTGTPGV